MPTISMFYGIIIRMYGNDHLPPHFHAFYQGSEAVFTLDGRMIEGNIPKKQRRLILAWVQLHYDELVANWELATAKEQPFKIEPLR